MSGKGEKSIGFSIRRGALLSAVFTFGLASILATGGGDEGGCDEPGTLQFSASSYSGNEDDGAITVTVSRTGGNCDAASVVVTDTNSGSAASGADYTAISSTTLSWADGESGNKFTVLLPIADGAYELDDTVILALSGANGATLGTPSSATVTILNDDSNTPGTLQFTDANYTVAEDGSGNATITVTRTGGDVGAATVNYATSDDTANAGSDYAATSGTLSWTDSDSVAQTFQIPIINDTDVEVPQTVILTLSGETGASLGAQSTATLTITSEDQYGTIQFGATSFNVDESVDGAVTNVITVQRVNGSSGQVSVEVSDAGGGSATGTGPTADYTFGPQTLTWDDGVTTDQYVTITVIDDSDSEGTETVNLALANATGGASIGTPVSTTVNIADDEMPPSAGELQFDSATYSVAENGGSISITVNRINGTSGAVGVSYATEDDTALAGVDYTMSSGTLSWSDGVGGAQTFSVSVTDNGVVEADKSLTLRLSTETGGVMLVSPSTAMLTITNDDTNLTMNIGQGTKWIAFQDGPNGAWTQWNPTSGNTYDFPVTDNQGRYGVAIHHLESDGLVDAHKVYVIHATIAELSSLVIFANPNHTVTGTLSNYTGTAPAAFALMFITGDGPTSVDPYLYTIYQVPEGNRDLYAFEADAGMPTNFVMRRDISITGDVNDQNVDFTNDGDVEAFNFVPGYFAGSSNGQLLQAFYSTSNGTALAIFEEQAYDGTEIIFPYIANVSWRQPGDAYSFRVSNASRTKYRIRNFSAVDNPSANSGDLSIGLGSLATLSGTSVNATQTTGLSYVPDPTAFSGNPVFRAYQIDLDQTLSGGDGVHWQIKISNGWLGASTTYTHPVFNTVSGFNSNWDLNSGDQTRATVSAVTSNNGTGLSLIVRRTVGRSSSNMNPITWAVLKRLAHSDSLKLDIAAETSIITW